MKLAFVRKIPYTFLLPAALLLGFAPFVPEPHLVDKVRLLFLGQLGRPIDIFDLLFHASPVILLAVKLSLVGWKGR